MAANQIGPEADGAAKTSHRHRYVSLVVADRIEHLTGDDHHRARLQTHRCSTRKVSEPSCQLLVLGSVKTVPVGFQSLCSYSSVTVPCPFVGPDDALWDQFRQRCSQLPKHALRP